jgi:hypothetical protein
VVSGQETKCLEIFNHRVLFKYYIKAYQSVIGILDWEKLHIYFVLKIKNCDIIF